MKKLRCLDPGCNQDYTSGGNGDPAIAVGCHARAAGHAVAPYYVTAVLPDPQRSFAGIAVMVVSVLVVAVIAASCSSGSGEQNDRQRCEADSPNSSIRFDDCKGMFPGQEGISGWD